MRNSVRMFTSEMVHHIGFVLARYQVGTKRKGTYTNDGRIIRDRGRLILFRGGGSLLNTEVLHVATSKYDIFVNLFGGCYFVCRVSSTAFGAVGFDTFEGHGRLFTIYFV